MIKIGDFANMFGVSIKTVRFYEEKNLLRPAYVDIYTGYRYFDEKNIVEMSRILVYKSLGFELSEIKDLDDESIENKISEYKKKINIMKSHISTLNSLLDSREEKIKNMKAFVNDEDAIGKWSLIGVSKSKKDFNNNDLLDDDIAIKDLYLMEGGTEYWVISWTKGSIYINRKPYSYVIEDNKMFINLKGLYDDEKVAAYEKINDKNYTIDEIMNLDNTDVPFIEDKKVNGLWNSIGTIKNKENFKLSDIRDNGILKRLSVFPKGEANITFNNDNSRSISYTKGVIKDLCVKGTMCSYEIKTIENKDYLIVEWKSGDYVFGGFVNCYYVFEKIDI